jgi:hypothetical protein
MQLARQILPRGAGESAPRPGVELVDLLLQRGGRRGDPAQDGAKLFLYWG